MTVVHHGVAERVFRRGLLAMTSTATAIVYRIRNPAYLPAPVGRSVRKEIPVKNRQILTNSLFVASAIGVMAFALVACDGSAPGKKPVTPKPVDPANAAAPAGANFKGGDTMQSTDKINKDADTGGETKK